LTEFPPPPPLENAKSTVRRARDRRTFAIGRIIIIVRVRYYAYSVRTKTRRFGRTPPETLEIPYIPISVAIEITVNAATIIVITQLQLQLQQLLLLLLYY